MKRVIIYCQEQENVGYIIKKLREYVKKKNWELAGRTVEACNSSDGLFEILNKLNEFDAILIYNRENILDEFNRQLLSGLATEGQIEIIEYRNQQQRDEM
ncbi:hypothetical protein H1164_17185 [Thermoactinomyces daqus]|uniref:Uncharacterized protein n=1 Tax=Thermoactinomyces daqus TaxID=1329516 RepID=A0A7W1XD99_9BACL|nr:hypothetical protein [Thermoactinomyces daqus]MBA4544565.1 hypothetical protein [Thermoactinomyces daqus]